ncbi:hypothetical protein [Motiliproteus sp. MSK22-1]|uniref:hypothetical protein n=1 Tax=Motiliproteus sp. MSK22-1 TaxID=1897630 RepID=UPI0009764BB9|nr:hypothetical protein [Motiliproteus sp. MSK22-1]OMH29171.1 hypothetical protein BGP75_20735 [Motiliproteus sp. MSK22-1]
MAKELDERHELITAGRQSGELRIDMTDSDSIRAAFEKVGKFEAVICCAGHTICYLLSAICYLLSATC